VLTELPSSRYYLIFHMFNMLLDDKVIEYQVLKSVRPLKWSVFKKPYNFHRKPANIQGVAFARGSTYVIVTDRKGCEGNDMGPRSEMMAQFTPSHQVPVPELPRAREQRQDCRGGEASIMIRPLSPQSPTLSCLD
jgi:hypothetical protein